MATITATGATTHPTLAAATVDVVTLNGDYQNVEVLNRDSAATIYFTVDGTTPGVAGDGTYIVPPGRAVNVPVHHVRRDGRQAHQQHPPRPTA
jgi:hypothetical protein